MCRVCLFVVAIRHSLRVHYDDDECLNYATEAVNEDGSKDMKLKVDET